MITQTIKNNKALKKQIIFSISVYKGLPWQYSDVNRQTTESRSSYDRQISNIILRK